MKTESLFPASENTDTEVLASSSQGLQIELVRRLGAEHLEEVLAVSEAFQDSFSGNFRFTRNGVYKFFNYPDTYPLIARFRGQIVGFIIGVPLEKYARDAWARYDKNFGKGNTVYTCAFAVLKKYHDFGIARMLKSVYRSWLKRRGYTYLTGHVAEDVAQNLSGEVRLIKRFENWLQTGRTFIYYRKTL